MHLKVFDKIFDAFLKLKTVKKSKKNVNVTKT